MVVWGCRVTEAFRGELGGQFCSIDKLRLERKVGSKRTRCGRDAGISDSFRACNGENTDWAFWYRLVFGCLIQTQALFAHIHCVFPCISYQENIIFTDLYSSVFQAVCVCFVFLA